jgi:hypothetical protein
MINVGTESAFHATLDIDSGEKQYEISEDVILSLDKKNIS